MYMFKFTHKKGVTWRREIPRCRNMDLDEK